jgi:hypothetical protein
MRYTVQRGGDQGLKKEYKRPELVEYGTLQQLTLGQTGNSPDWNILAGVFIQGEMAMHNYPTPNNQWHAFS